MFHVEFQYLSDQVSQHKMVQRSLAGGAMAPVAMAMLISEALLVITVC